jgi:hypothetical protein
LQKRYLHLVHSHLNVAQAIAAGIQAVPGVGSSFAATQAAGRFFANPRVTLPKLSTPLRELGRQATATSTAAYVLLVHDGSKLDYASHTSKTDLARLSNASAWGYELGTALLVEAADGAPLAPLGLTPRAAGGTHTTEHDTPRRRRPHLDQVLPWVRASQTWGLPRTPVHVIDREADAVKPWRRWHRAGHRFLVRADDRRVGYAGRACKLSAVVRSLRRAGQFTAGAAVAVRGRRGRPYVAEARVTVHEPGWARRRDGTKDRVPGPALERRLVVVQVRNDRGRCPAEWLLLSHVGDVAALQVATWYYWRWRIASFHKLRKAAGLELEEWQQESAAALAKRRLVACRACVTVWQLPRPSRRGAPACQALLVRLSGRQTTRSRPVTSPALRAGLNKLLRLLELLEDYAPAEHRRLAHLAVPHLSHLDSG